MQTDPETPFELDAETACVQYGKNAESTDPKSAHRRLKSARYQQWRDPWWFCQSPIRQPIPPLSPAQL